jgi:hypothetical protein
MKNVEQRNGCDTPPETPSFISKAVRLTEISFDHKVYVMFVFTQLAGSTSSSDIYFYRGTFGKRAKTQLGVHASARQWCPTLTEILM